MKIKHTTFHMTEHSNKKGINKITNPRKGIFYYIKISIIGEIR